MHVYIHVIFMYMYLIIHTDWDTSGFSPPCNPVMETSRVCSRPEALRILLEEEEENGYLYSKQAQEGGRNLLKSPASLTGTAGWSSMK